MAKHSLSKALEAYEQSNSTSSERFVDLQLDFCNQETGEVIRRFGGVWDRGGNGGNGDWAGDARTSMRIELHEGQLEGFEWFCDWFDDHLDRRFDADYSAEQDRKKVERIFSAMFGGGRRGGKSYLAIALTVAYAITIPDSICWVVCPTDLHYDEIRNYLYDFMPRSWWEELGAPHKKFMLVNGSDIFLRSAHTPNTLKKGRVDWAVMNEGQQMKEAAFGHVRAATSDKGGMCLVACNPPDDGDVGLWVGDFAVEAQESLRKAKYFFFDPLDNPNIDREALLSLADELDEHTYNVQVRGMFLAPKGAVFYNWDRTKNEKRMPEVFEDMTERFTQKHEGKAYTNIVHIDVNRFPYIACGIWKIVKNPRFPAISRAFAWCHDEISMAGGDEHDVCRELLERGYEAEDTIVVMDASGWWQSFMSLGNQTKVDKIARLDKMGMSSADIFHKYGFRCVRPDRRLEANPNIIERCRAVCARIKTKSGQRFLYIDPRCKQIAKAMQRWETKNGRPLKTSNYAHHGDGVGYFVWRYWPRRGRGDKESKRDAAVTSRKRRTRSMKNVY